MILKIWDALVLQDHWQGEGCVAFFGSVLWGVLATLSKHHSDTGFYVPAMYIVEDLFPLWMWSTWFILFGSVQLVGLFLNNHWLRLIGAVGTFVAFFWVFLGIAMARPEALSLSAYLVCVAIELFAIIYQTAEIIRYRRYPTWPILKRS